jgi:predicted AAA+ superfamily ATPase
VPIGRAFVSTAATTYRPRLADAYLDNLLGDCPAVLITGARATGKTTTAAQRVAQVERLDQPGTASAYRADPDAALRRAARPVLLDEWQEVPEVLAAVKRVVDVDATPGQFLLTGSVRAELTNETWAGTGRIVRTTMYGLTERELNDRIDTARPASPSWPTAVGTNDPEASG